MRYIAVLALAVMLVGCSQRVGAPTSPSGVSVSAQEKQKTEPAGTLALHEGSELYLDGSVTLDYTFSPDTLNRHDGVYTSMTAYAPGTTDVIAFQDRRVSLTTTYVLGSIDWAPPIYSKWHLTGGPAHCIARLFVRANGNEYNTNDTVLATIEFEATGQP